MMPLQEDPHADYLAFPPRGVDADEFNAARSCMDCSTHNAICECDYCREHVSDSNDQWRCVDCCGEYASDACSRQHTPGTGQWYAA